LRENRLPELFILVLPYSRLLCFLSFSSSYLSMSLRRPFVAPRLIRTKRLEIQSQSDKDGDVSSPIKTGVANQEEGYDQTPISEWRVSDDEDDLVPISTLLVAD
jgi:hypothetical protein